MRTTTKRRARQLALVTLAAPVAAWALEQAAHRAEARDQASPASRRCAKAPTSCSALVAGRWPTG
jgi:multisubunit Na+/H+ antiporter MnhG subunit